MNLLLDTNIILNIVRANNYPGLLNLIIPDNSILYISIVSEAELRSLAIRKKWGSRKFELLNGFLNGVNVMDVNEGSIYSYAEIDSYSQRSNPNFKFTLSA